MSDAVVGRDCTTLDLRGSLVAQPLSAQLPAIRTLSRTTKYFWVTVSSSEAGDILVQIWSFLTRLLALDTSAGVIFDQRGTGVGEAATVRAYINGPALPTLSSS